MIKGRDVPLLDCNFEVDWGLDERLALMLTRQSKVDRCFAGRTDQTVIKVLIEFDGLLPLVLLVFFFCPLETFAQAPGRFYQTLLCVD